MSPPRVAIVVVSLDGRDHLEGLLASLANLRYPRDFLEIVVVDNGSKDDTVSWLAACHPSVRVLRLDRNEGFARPNNLAAAAVTDAEFLALLNNDMKVDPSWLEQALQGFTDPDIACVGTRILNWDGTRVDYAGAGMTFDGFGLQPEYGADASRVRGEPGPVLFACGGAMVIRRQVFLDLGGFDEAFFAYFEDVDLGWRLWSAGHRVMYRPEAFVLHLHNGTSSRFPAEAKRLLMERNALQMLLKNVEGDDMAVLGLAGLLLTAVRAACRGNVEESSFRMAERPSVGSVEAHAGLLSRLGGILRTQGIVALCRKVLVRILGKTLRKLEPAAPAVVAGQVRIPAEAWAGVLALRDVAALWPDLQERRRRVQGMRRRPEAEILPLLRHPLLAVEGNPDYLAIQRSLVLGLGLERRYG